VAWPLRSATESKAPFGESCVVRALQPVLVQEPSPLRTSDATAHGGAVKPPAPPAPRGWKGRVAPPSCVAVATPAPSTASDTA